MTPSPSRPRVTSAKETPEVRLALARYLKARNRPGDLETVTAMGFDANNSPRDAEIAEEEARSGGNFLQEVSPTPFKNSY